MELIDRYVTEIGKHLPRKNRADIETEIRSTLEDMLADRSEKTGQPVDEAMVKDLLREYGAPDKVAATYLPERYLIGPRMFPLFWMVVRIVFAVLTALAIIGLGIRLGMQPVPAEAVAAAVGKAFLEYIQGMILAFGNIVLILAILERVLPEREIKQLNPSDGEKWDPDQLMQEPTGDEVKMWEPVVAILFTFAGLAIFNFYPQIIAMVVNPGSPQAIPLLSDAFFRYLPWLNLLWGLGIVQELVLLRMGRYTPATRWFSIVLKVGGIALAGAMLAGPSLVGITANQLTAGGMDPSASSVLVELMRTAVRLALVIAIVAGGADIIKEVYRLVVKANRPRPLLIHK